MPNIIRKLFHYLHYIRLAKKEWSFPAHSEVLIYDNCNSQILEKYLSSWKTEILHTRGEVINVPVLLSSIFAKGNRAQVYRDIYINCVMPKLIITLIDNNISFYSLSLKHPHTKTLFIQNGLRAYTGQNFELLDHMPPTKLSQLKVDYMLTLGDMTGSEYKRFIQGETFSLGSLRNNQIPKKISPVEPGTLAYISQWQPGEILMGHIKYTQEEIDRPIVEFLVEYAKKNNKELVVIPRTKPQSLERKGERAHFNQLTGNECRFLEGIGPYQSYEAIDRAEVIVTLDSTLGYEAIARDKKCAIFSIRTDLLGVSNITFGWPGKFEPEGFFWTSRNSSAAYQRILDYLFKVEQVQWLQDLERFQFHKIMNYDEDNSILKHILGKELK